MFEVRCLVADKRLADVLRALRKLTLEPPVTIAVDEPAASGEIPTTPAIDAVGRSAKQSVYDFVGRLRRDGDKVIHATQLREHMIACGFSPRAYSYPLALLVKNGELKMTRTSGIYEVV